MGVPAPLCASEYGRVTGLLQCNNNANWILTQDFTDNQTGQAYSLRVQLCDRHYDWHFIKKNFKCSTCHEPYVVVDALGRVLS